MGGSRLVGDDGSTAGSSAGGATANAGAPALGSASDVAKAVGEPCVSRDEYRAGFPGYDLATLNVDDHAATCDSGICIQNKFQGRASCPYGQTAGGLDCLLPNSDLTVSTPVSPQLVARQASVASICSCQCDGAGPGPFCTCPDSMQCEHLVDDIGATPPGAKNLSGSYCTPKGPKFDPQADHAVCLASLQNCGAPHPY